MKQYIQNLHARGAHEKRHYSMRAAAIIIAVIFLVWISTLGIRLESSLSAGNNAAVGASGTSNLAAVTAAVGSDIFGKLGQIKSSLSGTPVSGDAGQTAGTAGVPGSAPATVVNVPINSDTSPLDGSGTGGTN